MADDAQEVALAAEIAAVEEDWETVEAAALELLGTARERKGGSA